ncbi:MAG: hypothetical protein ABIJ30_11985 [bacterium]
MLTQIRRCSSTGRPAGDKNFGIGLEGLLGRILMAKPIGRPKKSSINRAMSQYCSE